MSAVSKILIALNRIKASMDRIEKTGHNKFQNYDYVEEAVLVSAVRTEMIKEGLLIIPGAVRDVEILPGLGSQNNQILMSFVQSFTLAHESGEVWPHPIEIVAAGIDAGDKQPWKASTGANKYLLMRILQLATGDDPEQPNVADKEAQATPRPARSPSKGSTAKQTTRTAGSDSVEEKLRHIDPDVTASSALLKQIGFWPVVFKASEKFFGKDEARKFDCLDSYLSTLGLRSAKQLKVGHLAPFFRYAETWSPASPEPPFDEEPEEPDAAGCGYDSMGYDDDIL